MSPASHAVKFLRESYRRVLSKVLRKNAEAFAYPGFEGLEPRLLMNAAPEAGNDQFATWIERVSVSSNGVQGDQASYGGATSADGRYVAFESDASNLAAGDTNGAKDIFVRDRLTGATERVSVSSSGEQANGASGAPSISADGRYVLFESVGSNLVSGDTNGRIDIFVHDRQTGTTQRVTVSSNGVEQNGDSQDGRISGDGRYAVFASYATNLVPGGADRHSDIFVRDLQAGTTEEVSVSSRGVPGSQGSYRPSISADGRYVTFTSYASLLVPGDRNSAYDVFVRDRVAGTTTLVDGGAGASYTDPTTGLVFPTASQYHPSVSADGRHVAFDTDAWTPTSENDTNNGVLDVFVHDQQTDTTRRISVSTTGGDTDGASSMPSITRDGRYVVFRSYATNLVPDDTNGVSDLFAYDLVTGTMRRLSESAAGTQGNGGSSSLLSSGLAGPYAAFGSEAANLTPGDTNGVADTYFVRLAPGATDEDTALRITSDRFLANDTDPDEDTLAVSEVSGTSQYGATVTLNEDGSITYDPSGSDYLHGLAAGDMANDTFSYTVSDGHGGTATATVTLTVAGVDDPTDGSDLQNTRGFLGDSSYNTNSNTALTAGNDTLSTQIERVDASVGEGISDRSSAVTPDGRYVAFESASMAGGNGFSNIYLYDRQLNTTILVSVTPDGTTLGNADSYSPSISADGRYVAFSSQASNLDARDEQGCSNVFVYDRETQQVQLVSVGSDGATPGNGDSLSPSISADGQYVAFASGATNLIAAGSRGIFVRDLAAETTELASVTSPDAYGKQDPATGFNSRPVISADGRYVAFQSTATNLGDSHAGWFGNIYVHDRETGSTQWVTARTTSTVPATGFMYLDGISADGQSVVFDSGATNLVVSSTPSTYPSWSVYVARLDESAWTVSRVSLGDFESESQYYIASSRGQITSDGRYVVFEAYTTERGTPGAWDVLVADLAPEGATIRLSELAGGDALNGSTRMSQGPATIGDYAVLWSDATDLVPGDANGGLFVARLAPGATDANTPMRIRASLLLANDGGDSPTITDVTYTGEYEASVTLNEEDGSITYDPTDSTVFKALAAGDTREDTFTYDVSDGENGTLTNTVTVTVAGVNDAPVADNVELSVDENAADNDVVGQVTARDPDTGDTLTYAITGGNKDGVFAIDSSGHIRVADHTKLSYDATAAYALTVTVKDGKNLSGTATVAILVNDVASNHSPVVYAAELHVDENSGSGTVVGRAIAWDVDAGDTLTYAITGTAFAIDSTTGLITVTGTTQLHYDTASSYQLTVTVTDNHNASVTAAETILVNDVSNNHYPSVAGTTFYVNSDSAVGTVVGRVMASDADANDRLTYAITGGNTDDAFTIDSQTGDLIVHDVAPLWAESTFGLTVAVTDRDNQTSTVTVTVLVDASNSSGGTPGLHGINGFQVQGSGDNVELSWNGVAGAVGYNVYKWDGTDWGYLDSTDSQTRTYTDTYAEEDHHYGANEIYYVAAVNGLGAVIAASPPQTGTTAPQVLAEDDLDLTATDDGHGHLELQWSPVQGAQQYEIHRKTKSGDIWVEDGDPIGYVYDAVKFVDMHCTENTRYRYSIIASYTINDVGQVGWSGMSADSGEAWVARSEYEKTLEYADLAIDSDNTSDAGPQQDGYEEATENTQGLPGKIIVVNDAYRNDNNIPDFAEPTALDTSSLVPMVFRIHYPGWMLGNVLWKDTFLNHHWVTFNYNAASAAAQVGTAPDDNPAYAIAGGDVSKGAYRLWLPSEKNPSSPVARSTLTFIDANEVRSLASLGFGCSGEYDSVTLYVEAVRPSAALGDTIEVLGDNYDDLNICGTPSATSLQKSIDTIRVTAVQDMDANAYSGLVRLADGTVSLTETDFASNAYGMPWGATRTFTNDPVLSLNKLNGNGWSDLPYLIQGTSTMMVVQGGSARYFDKVMDAVGNGFHYEGRFDTLANLTKIVDTFTGDSSYKLTEADGSTWSFCGFGNTIAPYPLYQRGAFQQYVGPGGDSVGVTSRTVDGKPLMIARGVETFRYAYDAADGETTDAGKLRRVTLERLISGSAAKAIESVRYDYDTSGNLTKAIVSRSVTPDANSPEAMTDLDTFTYTYDARSNGETADNAIRLLTATEPDTNARSNHSAPDYSFTYDDDRVDTQAVLGAGASGGNTVGTFTYNYYRADYDTRANADGSGVGINAWRMRTTVDSPDGAEQRVYTNFAGQQMVSEVGGGWRTFTRYDRAGRVILSAQPSAVSCLFQSRSDLLYMVSGHYELLKDDIGLITRYTYGTGASSDQPKGYLIETALLKGERDSAPDLQKTIRYTSDTPIPVVYTEKAYKSDDGNNGVTTYYTYPHWTGCVPTTVTTTLPDVSGQNGSAANTFTTCSDSYGRVIWSKDGNGTLSCTGYDDERNGAVDLSVADVDTSLEGFDSGPFTSTAGTHLHLTTTIRADDLGRPMEITDSAGRKTTFTYYDSASQSSVWSMLVDTADDNPPPRQYTITDRAAGTVAAGTASRTSDTKYSKSETVYDAGGRVSKQRRYTDPNSTSSYYESTTTYNTAGLVDSVTDEAGTVTTTEYDLLGRRINVKAGIAAISLISEYQYDNGGVGDGTLTRVTTHDDSGAHEAKYTYDYRGRQLSDSDPNSPIAGDKYDNFNDLRFSETYVGSTLRNWSEVTYDDLGRPYKTVTTADTLSTQKNHTLTSQVWHDADGRVVKTQDANGLFTKTKYDSLGRIVATYTGYNDSASDVDVISSDTIIQQTETIYDKKGNSVATLSFSRFPSVASGGGKLTAANSYATAVIRWYDYAGRLIGTADFGREDIHANSAWPRHVFALATGYLIDTDSDGIPDVAA
ncbi:MAG: cadherin domain-containing protein, partial [Planctomycetota bacterium]|nr:cadherin domain-containing protein [Planctomycetota bacterium]